MNIYEEIANNVTTSIKGRAERIKQRDAAKLLDDSAKKQYEADLLEAQSIMRDPRYPALQRFFSQSGDMLREKLKGVLIGDWHGYSREARADKAAIINAQIALLEEIQNAPKNIIENCNRFLK